MNRNDKLPKKKPKISIFRTALAIVVPLMLLAVAVPKITDSPWNDKDIPVSDGSVSDAPEVDPNAGEYVEPQEEDTKSGGIAVPGWNTLNIPKNEKEVTVDFYNPEENKGQYHLTFELRLPDKSKQGYEVLYKSGLVDPGLHIQKITLSRELEEGIYDATLHVQPYRMDEQKTATNNADMQTQLIVK